MVIPLRPCPCRRQGNHVHEVARGDHGTAYVVSDHAGYAAHPCVHGVKVLDLCPKSPFDEDLTNELCLVLDAGAGLVHDDDGDGGVDK